MYGRTGASVADLGRPAERAPFMAYRDLGKSHGGWLAGLRDVLLARNASPGAMAWMDGWMRSSCVWLASSRS